MRTILLVASLVLTFFVICPFVVASPGSNGEIIACDLKLKDFNGSDVAVAGGTASDKAEDSTKGETLVPPPPPNYSGHPKPIILKFENPKVDIGHRATCMVDIDNSANYRDWILRPIPGSGKLMILVLSVSLFAVIKDLKSRKPSLVVVGCLSILNLSLFGIVWSDYYHNTNLIPIKNFELPCLYSGYS